MTDHTSTRMTAREKAVWDATFAAAFVEQTRRGYDVTAQMGSQSALYGMSFGECALESAYSNAEVASGVADAAVYGIRLLAEDGVVSIADRLECLDITKEAVRTSLEKRRG